MATRFAILAASSPTTLIAPGRATFPHISSLRVISKANAVFAPLAGPSWTEWDHAPRGFVIGARICNVRMATLQIALGATRAATFVAIFVTTFPPPGVIVPSGLSSLPAPLYEGVI